MRLQKAFTLFSVSFMIIWLTGCTTSSVVPQTTPPLMQQTITITTTISPTAFLSTPEIEPTQVSPTWTLRPLPEPGAVNTADTLDELRRLDRVQPITQLTGRQGELEASNGNYGFTIPLVLSSYLVSGLQVRGNGRIPLASVYQRPLTLEVHVTPMGQILIVGFASEDDIRQLTAPERKRPLTISLYTQPFQHANRPLSLAANLILQAQSDQVNAQVDRITLLVGGIGSERVLSAESVPAIRRMNKVKPLPPQKNVGGYDLNEGYYGFAALWSVEQIHGFRLQVSGLGKPPINNAPKDEMQLELHHTSEGELYLVGFISKEDLQRAKDVTRQDLASVMMITYPSPVYDQAVAISVEMIQSGKNLQGVPGKPASSVELLLRGYIPPAE